MQVKFYCKYGHILFYLFQELLSLLYEAEIAVARCVSLRKKFNLDHSTANSLDTSSGSDGSHRRRSSASGQPSGTRSQTAAIDVNKFVLDLVDNPEVSIPGAGKGTVGKLVSQLFVDSMKVSSHLPALRYHMCVSSSFWL